VNILLFFIFHTHAHSDSIIVLDNEINNMGCLTTLHYQKPHCLPFTHPFPNKQVGKLPTLLNMSGTRNSLKKLLFWKPKGRAQCTCSVRATLHTIMLKGSWRKQCLLLTLLAFVVLSEGSRLPKEYWEQMMPKKLPSPSSSPSKGTNSVSPSSSLTTKNDGLPMSDGKV